MLVGGDAPNPLNTSEINFRAYASKMLIKIKNPLYEFDVHTADFVIC